MPEKRIERRLAAILAADIAGYSRMMGADEAGTLGLLRELRANVLDPAVSYHHGRLVKVMGDGALVEFASAVDAVECAVAIQGAMAAHNATRTGLAPIEFRIGVNLGDIVIEGDDIFGDGVNVAARLEAQAPRNGILVSDAIHAQVRGKIGVVLEDAGELALKNIAQPVRVWRWGGEAGAPQSARPAAVLPESGPNGPESGPAAGADMPSVAVLPFTNMSNDPEQEYFSDGISEDIITDLSKVTGLMVVARNSSFTYKGRNHDVRVVGRELGVGSVLEGSIRRAGNRVRITAQLVDARTGGHLWADRYDRELTDIFAVQDEVTLRIVDALKVTLKPAELTRVLEGGTRNLRAHDFMLRARELQAELLRGLVQGRDKMDQALALMREAIEADPDFALPYAYMAMLYTLEFNNNWLKIPDALDQAERYAKLALEKDPQEPVAHNAAAVVGIFLDRLDEARAHCERALELNPSFATAYSTLGNILMFQGHPEDAVPNMERAMRLDPVSRYHYVHFVGMAQMMMGHYAEAVETFHERIRLAPTTDLSRSFLASALGHLGRIDEAQTVWAELIALNPEYSAARHYARLPFRRPEDKGRMAEGVRRAGIEI